MAVFSYVTHASFKTAFDWHLESKFPNTFYYISCVKDPAKSFIRAIIKDCITKLGPSGPASPTEAALMFFPREMKKYAIDRPTKETAEARLRDGIKYSTLPLRSS